MSNILSTIENEQIAKRGASIPKFATGDTLKVHTRIKEGEKSRIQIFEGVCIARKNAGINSAFTVRKISFGEGVERNFPLYSPNVEKIEVVKIGKVRRAKLYYLRELSGKKARIVEDLGETAKRAGEAASELKAEKAATKEEEAKKVAAKALEKEASAAEAVENVEAPEAAPVTEA